ncbi:MAG: hypothetical protein K8U57_40500 [Planctomycetes bacterium]|nr:hypothetical protein [Planctomycetota bacterium]
MTIPIICPGCDAAFDVPDELVGKTIRCITCKAQVTVSDELAGVTGEATKKPFGSGTKTVPATPKAKAAIRDEDEDEPETKATPAKKTKIAAAGAGTAFKGGSAKKRPLDDDDDDRPKSKKKKQDDDEEKPSKIAYYGGGLLTVLFLIGVITKVFFGSATKKDDTASNSSSTTTPANTTAPNTPVAPVVATNWQPVNVGAEFACEMPGTPTQRNENTAGGATVRGFLLESPAKDSAFFAFVVPLPQVLPPNLIPQVLNQSVTEFERGMNNGAGGGGFGGGGFGKTTQVRLTGRADIQQNGFPGKEMQIAGSAGKESLGGVMRFVIAGKNMYLFGVGADNYAAFSAQSQRFMASVKISASQNTGGPVVINDPPSKNPVPPVPITDPKPPIGTPVPPTPITDPKPPIGPNPMPPAGGEVAGKLAAKLNNAFNAGAFDTEKKELIVVGSRKVGPRFAGTIQRYSYPDFKLQGTVNIPSSASRAVIDSQKGLLYISTIGAGWDPTNNQFDRPAYISDMAVYDLAQLRSGKFDEKTDLKPVATVGVGFSKITTRDIALSNDGKYLYILTSIPLQGGRLTSQVLRVDTSDRKTTKSVNLPNAGWDMLLSPDGQKVYITANMPAGAASPLMVVDANTMTVGASFTLPKPAYSLAVAKDGRIVASSLNTAPAGGIGGGLGGPPMGGIGPIDPNGVGGVGIPQGEIHVLDADGKKVEAMRQVNTGVSNNGYVAVSPDGKYLICSSHHPKINGTGLDVYETSDKFIGDKQVASMKKAGEAFLGGAFLVSPESDYIVMLNGAVLKLDDLNDGPVGGGPGGFGPPPGGVVPPGGGFPQPPPGGVVPPGGIGVPPGVKPMPPGN